MGLSPLDAASFSLWYTVVMTSARPCRNRPSKFTGNHGASLPATPTLEVGGRSEANSSRATAGCSANRSGSLVALTRWRTYTTERTRSVSLPSRTRWRGAGPAAAPGALRWSLSSPRSASLTGAQRAQTRLAHRPEGCRVHFTGLVPRATTVDPHRWPAPRDVDRTPWGSAQAAASRTGL